MRPRQCPQCCTPMVAYPVPTDEPGVLAFYGCLACGLTFTPHPEDRDEPCAPPDEPTVRAALAEKE